MAMSSIRQLLLRQLRQCSVTILVEAPLAMSPVPERKPPERKPQPDVVPFTAAPEQQQQVHQLEVVPQVTHLAPHGGRRRINVGQAVPPPAARYGHPQMPSLRTGNLAFVAAVLLSITAIQHHRSTSGACKRKGGSNSRSFGDAQSATIGRRILWLRIWGSVVLAIAMLFSRSLRSSPSTTPTSAIIWTITPPPSSGLVAHTFGTMKVVAAATRPPR